MITRVLIAAAALFSFNAQAQVVPSPTFNNLTLTGTLSGGLLGTNASSANVTGTGGSTAQTLAALLANPVNPAFWGFAQAASGATNKAALVSAIAQSCTQATPVVALPAGTYFIDLTAGEILVQCAGSNTSPSIIGQGKETILAPTGNNHLFHFSPPGGQVNAGHNTIAGFRVYTTANPTAGAAISLDHTNTTMLHDLEITGTFNSIDCVDCVGIYATNINLDGDNTATGAQMLRFRRASNATTDVNPSENFFSNFNMRSGASTYVNAVVINDCDGCWFNNGHIGFTSGAMILVKPERNAGGGGTNADQIDGIHLSNVDLDTGQSGLDFEHLAAFAGAVDGILVSGGTCARATTSCVLLNDASVSNISFTAFGAVSNQNRGYNIQAGSNISIVGGNFEANNLANSSSQHLYIGGTSSHVTVTGATFAKATAPAMPNSIVVGDTADYVSIGVNDYKGSAGIDVSYTSSGTHNPPPTGGSTDYAQKPWVQWFWTSTGAWQQNSWGDNVLHTYGPNSAVVTNYPEIASVGAGGIVTYSAAGADGAATQVTFAPPGTGVGTYGITTSPASVIPTTLAVGAQAVTAGVVSPPPGATAMTCFAKFSAVQDQCTLHYQLYVVTAGAAAVRLTTDGSGTAGLTNCGNLNSIGSHGTIKNITLTAINHTTPTKGFSWFLPTAYETRPTNVASYALSTGAVAITTTIGAVGGSAMAFTADTTNACPNASWTPPTANTDTWNAMLSFDVDVVK